MAENGQKPEALKAAVAVVLTFVAGYVDAVGWLSLDRVFTAQMSGNFVLLAVHIVAGEKDRVLLQADAICAFFLGLVITGSIIEIGMRRRMQRIFIVALVVEFVLLAVFAAGTYQMKPAFSGEEEQAPWWVYALIAVIAFAMGTQNTSLRMAGILSVFTTHVTGAISGLSQEIIVCVFALLAPRSRKEPKGGFASGALQEKHGEAVKNIVRSTLLLAGFFAGAFAGASAAKAVGVGAAVGAPLALLVVVGLVDWFVPLTEFPSPVEKE